MRGSTDSRGSCGCRTCAAAPPAQPASRPGAPCRLPGFILGRREEERARALAESKQTAACRDSTHTKTARHARGRWLTLLRRPPSSPPPPNTMNPSEARPRVENGPRLARLAGWGGAGGRRDDESGKGRTPARTLAVRAGTWSLTSRRRRRPRSSAFVSGCALGHG